jgi:hypothetical protein
LNPKQIDMVLNFFIELETSYIWSEFLLDNNLIQTFIYHLNRHKKSDWALLTYENERGVRVHSDNFHSK